MKIIGLVFALVLLFLPLSVSLKAQAEPQNSDSIASSDTKNTMSFFKKKIMERLEKMDSMEEIREFNPEASASILTKIESIQRTIGGILKKLNNTE